jgi:hypothetical protein
MHQCVHGCWVEVSGLEQNDGKTTARTRPQEISHFAKLWPLAELARGGQKAGHTLMKSRGIVKRDLESAAIKRIDYEGNFR